MSSPNNSPAPVDRFPADSSPFLSFEQSDGVELYSSQGKRFVVINETVDYPEAVNGQVISAMLLNCIRTDSGERHLELPENYVTLSQALNDAIGDNTSDRAKAVAHGLMREVGSGLARVALYDGLAPYNISYKNIIFSREERGAQILPPVTFCKFETSDKARVKERVIEDFRASLQRNVANTTQRGNVPGVFASFKESFDW